MYVSILWQCSVKDQCRLSETWFEKVTETPCQNDTEQRTEWIWSSTGVTLNSASKARVLLTPCGWTVKFLSHLPSPTCSTSSMTTTAWKPSGTSVNVNEGVRTSSLSIITAFFGCSILLSFMFLLLCFSFLVIFAVFRNHGRIILLPWSPPSCGTGSLASWSCWDGGACSSCFGWTGDETSTLIGSWRT